MARKRLGLGGAGSRNRQSSSPHHLIRCGVLVGIVQVALAIMWLYQAPQLPIQRNVWHIIRGEHQQVQRILPPADLLLVNRG